MNEPTATAGVMTLVGVLLAISVLFSRAAGRAGLPLAFVFVLVGMLAGTDGVGRFAFDDYALAFRLGTVALVIILFDGGLNTPLTSVRAGLAPATVLATLGVVLMAGAMGAAAHLFGLPWPQALLLGAIVSSTDAAAVFAVLRGSGLHLKQRVGVTLELESGLNDPMAVILTMALTQLAATGEAPTWRLAGDVLVQLVVGLGAGVGFGWLGQVMLRRARLPAAGLYPVLTLALAAVAFGVPSLFNGSGFLAVYVAGALVGHETGRYRTGLLRVHDAMAWLSQVGMFLLLGLLATPSRLPTVANLGLGLGFVAALVVRPLVVWLCLVPFRFSMKERAYLGFVGLRGAVPIVLATFPVLAGAPGAQGLFDTVFFIVLVNTFVPGAFVGWLTRAMGLQTSAPPPPPAVMELTSTHILDGDVRSFFVRPQSAVAGATLAELGLPETSVVTLIMREGRLLAPRGNTRLEPGDYVSVFTRKENISELHLLFGDAQGE
ncbi:MAG: potassium/proton antiporter [Myxococcales bacterium]|nr:potassium/proton antiporter [Myxococcales bacterium]MDP3500621.1 potassium/proton antiporter [Myxococcales bacterium]